MELSEAGLGMERGGQTFLVLAVRLLSLVTQIEFTEWTPDGHLRHSKFVRLRADEEAREVVHEGQKSPE